MARITVSEIREAIAEAELGNHAKLVGLCGAILDSDVRGRAVLDAKGRWTRPGPPPGALSALALVLATAPPRRA